MTITHVKVARLQKELAMVVSKTAIQIITKKGLILGAVMGILFVSPYMLKTIMRRYCDGQ
jgi:hypothetical protein